MNFPFQSYLHSVRELTLLLWKIIFSAMTIELVDQDPNTGLIEPPDVSEPKNGGDPVYNYQMDL